MAATTDRLLGMTVTFRDARFDGIDSSALAIASSSAVYGFCCLLDPTAAEQVAIMRSAPSRAVLQTMRPIPSRLFFWEPAVTTMRPYTSLSASTSYIQTSSRSN